jgi:hypothetical protein
MFALDILRGECATAAKIAAEIQLDRLIFVFAEPSFDEVGRETVGTDVGRASVSDGFGFFSI